MNMIREIGKTANRIAPATAAMVAVLALLATPAFAQTVADVPLSVGGNVPGNLLLTPSVEFPTVDSVANLGETYDGARVYTGYFDSYKCYQYSYSTTEADRHFYPVSTNTTRACSGAWSGNYLNWAATQTIDPFRKALTGGYRVKDTPTETFLEKARSDGNSSSGYFRNRNITGGTVTTATPATSQWADFRTRISRAGNKMLFARTNIVGGETAALPTRTPYDPSTHTLNSNADNTVYEVSMRVKVCDATIGVEANCVQYSQGWKPEGLIQKYSNRIRYSAFGYLNDGNVLRDGGALRARQKFVGPLKKDPTDNDWVANANREWDATTGVQVVNPDPDDASATNAIVAAGGGSTVPTVNNSGVINYINKFGQMTAANHKSFDPVSELYYTAIRYLKNQGNVSAYTDLSGNAQTRYNFADGFPVITNWNDPIQYSCQNNAILGIGDANTHRDKNLPGHTGSTTDEPTRPTEVTADTTVDVRTAILKVAEREGITINLNDFTGRYNSAYIAGLAYDSHTNDLRPAGPRNIAGKQTVSTYWVDVRENSVLESRARNQYWLAAKYGGFEVPDDFQPYVGSDPLPNASWRSGETLENGDPRPENFYVASEANKMVESLTRAFARIAAESVGSASSLASNSTRLDTDTRTFQAQFYSGSWRGELNSFSVASDGSLSASPVWRASNVLASTTWSSRNIKVNVSGALQAFEWGNLTPTQQTALGSANVVNYLRGERAHEEAQTGGTLRTRTGILGDIVNSTPVYVGAPNARLYAAASFTGASAYAAFATANQARTPIVYVGANDGMLHAFNANTGAEVFAFVPAAAIANNLAHYADPDYEHRYFVDGEIAVADIYNGTSWQTVLVGTLGRGGTGAFALDVTNPASPTLLWERDVSNAPQLGRNIGRPVIAQVANGVWRVLIGNGPLSSAGRSQLIEIGLGGASNGVVTTVITPETSTVNGLSAVLARDSDADGFADTAYAGDLQGNLWKFSNLGGTATVTKLFEALDASSNRQPITAAPLVGRHPTTGQVWVFFGTGQYLDEPDIGSDNVQTWYGLKDNGTLISGRGALIARSIERETADMDGNPSTANTGPTVRVIEEGTESELDSSQGWYIDLISPVNGAEGERMVVPNRFQGVALIGTSRIPEEGDPCNPGGRGFVMAINPFTGSRLATTFFDINGDGQFNQADMVCGTGGCVPVSGIGFNSSPNNPIFIENVMQVGLDNGTTRTIRTQGSAVQATRMSWRELLQAQ